jgi:hypothetical protein
MKAINSGLVTADELAGMIANNRSSHWLIARAIVANCRPSAFYDPLLRLRTKLVQNREKIREPVKSLNGRKLLICRNLKQSEKQ